MQRIDEIDFLKGCLIVLVISFHLVYIGDLHPYAKRVVYTFHMPGFLFISGYLMNVHRRWLVIMRTMLSSYFYADKNSILLNPLNPEI